MMLSRLPIARWLPSRWGRGFVLFAVALLLAISSSQAIAATPRHYDELEFPPLPEVQLPDYERYQLDNGLTVYLVEDRELPLVTGTALIRTGSRFEPADKVGLAELTGIVMRSGGTEAHPADELNRLLENRAASIETSIDTTAGSASFDALSEDLPLVLDLFAEVLQQPAFPEDKLALAKKQLAGGIERRNDDPDAIASREFSKLIYGDRSPYARTVEYETLANIERADLVNFYQQSVQPNRVILGLTGDFSTAEVKPLIAQAFGNWPAATAASLPPEPEVNAPTPGGVFFIEQPQLTQSYIQLGHLGGRLDSPDYPALSVLNGVLNGFGGRLFNDVRSRQGLAYVVYGFWSPRYDYPGVFVAGGQTRSEATVPFVRSILDELERIRREPISADELAYAKESILNSFVFNFQDPGQTLSRLMRYEYYGYPDDFIFTYQRAVKATTAADVLRAAQTYLQPDQVTTLVVGNANEIQPPLSQLTNAVQTVDITIPAPPAG